MPASNRPRAAWAKRRWVSALAVVALVMAGIVVGSVPAAAGSAVGALTPSATNTVGPETGISAGQRLGKAVLQSRIVVATAVAAESATSETTILGENMAARVQSFADATGGRTLGFGSSQEAWDAMSPAQRWKLNDGQSRARVHQGDDFRYMGQHPERSPLLRQQFDLTRSELLRLDDRGIPYDIVSPSEVFKTIGRW